MSAAVATNYMELVERLPLNSLLILNDVSWGDYENLLEEIEGDRHVRISYDQGRMEIITLSFGHERWKSFFAHLLAILAEELSMPLIGGGQVTLKRKRQARGKEPDDCYYIHHAAEVRGKDEIDLAIDPPPDLAIEVDVTSPTLDKFPIYVSLGVLEIWRYENDRLSFYRLAEARYEEIEVSDLFPFLTPTVLLDFLRLGNKEDITAMNRAFREWVKQQRAAGRA